MDQRLLPGSCWLRNEFHGPRAGAWAVFSILLLAGACGDTGADAPGRMLTPDEESPLAAGPSSSPATEPPTDTEPTVPSKLSGLVHAIDRDFPDPGVVLDQGSFYAYATNGDGSNVRTAKSSDLTTWTRLGDALPTLPSWARANAGLTWAPDVLKLPDGTFLMYFTARDGASDKQCIGVAVANQAVGPFRSTASSPLVCQSKLGGTIDASVFRSSSGRLFLLYKNDGNCCNIATHLWGRELAPTGLSFIGDEVDLLKADQGWESGLIEAPAMIEKNGQFYLFYSANQWWTDNYATGVAIGSTPLGPFVKQGGGMFLPGKNQNLRGPGGLTPTRDANGNAYVFFHQWNSDKHDYRRFDIAPLIWSSGTPQVLLGGS